MATVEELLRAAKKADAAGDTDAARKLMQLAKTGMGVGKPSAADPANPLMPPPHVAYGASPGYDAWCYRADEHRQGHGGRAVGRDEGICLRHYESS